MAAPPDLHTPPAACPTCRGPLRVSGLACDACGTEVRGRFRHCEFCGLDDEQRALLRVFLAARGNAKELERHLGVSYPTARARLDQLLGALGINAPQPRFTDRRELLGAVAGGEIDVDEALDQLDPRRTG